MAHTCWPSGSTGSSEILHPAGYGSSARPSGQYRERQCEEVLYSSFWNPTQKSGEGIGVAFPKMCGAMDGGAQAPQGCAAGAFFGKATPIPSSRRHGLKGMHGLYKQKRHQPRTVVAFSKPGASDQAQATSAICNLIFFIAFFSSCRIRSADTPYLSASSCNVDLLSVSQRSRRISWLRSSRFSIACISRPLESSDQSAFSSCTAGSLRRSSR